VVSTVIGLIGTGKVIDQVLKAYVFQVEHCSFPYSKYPEVRIAGSTPQQAECDPVKDTGRANEEIAEGLGMAIPAIPLAWFAYKGMRKRDEA